MPYEGYEQILCTSGHYDTEDYLIFNALDWKCPICGKPAAWSNSVDLTNGSFLANEDGTEERIDGYVELKISVPARVYTCPTCSITHVTEPARYKIPEDKGNRET